MSCRLLSALHRARAGAQTTPALARQSSAGLYARGWARLGGGSGGAALGHTYHSALIATTTRGGHLPGLARALPSARSAVALRARVRAGVPTTARRSMFVQTSATPNPDALMFLPGEDNDVMGEGNSRSFEDARESLSSPLADALFQIEGVIYVFFGPDYVSVTKTAEMEWDVLKPDIFSALVDFYTSGKPILIEGAELGSDTEIFDDDDEVVVMIKELLETRIRPAIQEDGGDIAYRGFEEGFVKLQLKGACVGCPSSSATLKGHIEAMMMHYIPEVHGVRDMVAEDAEAEEAEAANAM